MVLFDVGQLMDTVGEAFAVTVEDEEVDGRVSVAEELADAVLDDLVTVEVDEELCSWNNDKPSDPPQT